MFNKTPSALGKDAGLLSVSRFHRTYCKHCKGEELHHSGVCVQCKKGGINLPKVKMQFNGKHRGMA